MKDLQHLYKEAAMQADKDGVYAGSEMQLVKWIWANCTFPLECLFYLVLGIGSELADLQARRYGYKHDVERAFVAAKMELLFPSF